MNAYRLIFIEVEVFWRRSHVGCKHGAQTLRGQPCDGFGVSHRQGARAGFPILFVFAPSSGYGAGLDQLKFADGVQNFSACRSLV
jgi:hypothetical protein